MKETVKIVVLLSLVGLMFSFATVLWGYSLYANMHQFSGYVKEVCYGLDIDAVYSLGFLVGFSASAIFVFSLVLFVMGRVIPNE